MDHRPRKRLTYANVMATLAVFLVLGGGTALAAYVVSSNSQIGPGTVSGHKPPSGDHANIIPGSVTGTDLANSSVSGDKLQSVAKFHKATGVVGPSQVLSLDGLEVTYQCVFTGTDDQPVLRARTAVNHATITSGLVSNTTKFTSDDDFLKTDFFSLTQNYDFAETITTYTAPDGHVVTLDMGFDTGTTCHASGLATAR